MKTSVGYWCWIFYELDAILDTQPTVSKHKEKRRICTESVQTNNVTHLLLLIILNY